MANELRLSSNGSSQVINLPTVIAVVTALGYVAWIAQQMGGMTQQVVTSKDTITGMQTAALVLAVENRTTADRLASESRAATEKLAAELKVSTGLLAAESRAATEKLAAADIVTRERITRLETQVLNLMAVK